MIHPVPQNHPELPRDVQRAGCLFISLMRIAEMHAGKTLPVHLIVEAYNWLCEEGHMLDSCWVNSPTAVIKAAQHYLGEPQAAEYVWREEHDDHDFGTREAANYFIGHSHTGRHGHFWNADRNEWPTYDPYFPTPARVRIIGYRGYRL